MLAFELSSVNLDPSIRLKHPFQGLGAQAIANEGFLNLQSLDGKHHNTDKTPPFHVHDHPSWERDNQVKGLKEMERAQCTDQLGAQSIGPDSQSLRRGRWVQSAIRREWGLGYGPWGFWS